MYWRTDGGKKRGSLVEIRSYYQTLEWGRLVVLGKEGAGKTVLAVTLIRDLAAAIVGSSPSENSGWRARVPVRLSLPAFDPAPGVGDLTGVPAEEIAAQLDQWWLLIWHATPSSPATRVGSREQRPGG